MFRTNRNTRARWLKLIAALLCLVPTLLGQTRLVPALLALGATLEGSHTVFADLVGGSTKVVLSHQRGHADRADFNPGHHPGHPSHRHGLAAKVLGAFAALAPDTSDHVAWFKAVASSELARRHNLSSPKCSTDGFTARPAGDRRGPYPMLVSQPGLPATQPSGPATLPLSIILLI